MPFAYVAAVVAVVGAGIGAYSASEQASYQKQQADYQAKVAANNAKIAEYQRQAALQQGQADAEKAMTEQAQMLSRQRASLAANGVDVTQGSALDVLASTKFMGQQDVNAIQSNAAREAWGYDVSGGNAIASSNLERWKASTINPTKQGVMTGASSLLSSASSYASYKAK